MSDRIVIGWREWIDLPDWGIRIRAKADTGAKNSAIDCAEIVEIPGERVRFTVRLSRKKDQLVTLEEPIAQRKNVRSSTGQLKSRFFVETTLRLGGLERRILVSLVCRKNMIHRMLLGRETLRYGLIVDSAVDHWVTEKRAKKPKVSR